MESSKAYYIWEDGKRYVLSAMVYSDMDSIRLFSERKDKILVHSDRLPREKVIQLFVNMTEERIKEKMARTISSVMKEERALKAEREPDEDN